MAEKYTEITIVRATKAGGKVRREGEIVPVEILAKGDADLLINLGKARPTTAADKAAKAAKVLTPAAGGKGKAPAAGGKDKVQDQAEGEE